MKKFLLLFAVLLLLYGCSSESGYKVTKPIGEVSTPELLALSYENFDGKKFGDHYPVAAGETVDFQVSVDTRGGSLTIYLALEDGQGETVFKSEDIQTSEFSFTIDEPGEYALYLEAKDHQGGYSIKTVRSMNP